MGKVDVFPTVEVRWFNAGRVPGPLLGWFRAESQEPDEPAHRVDYYLRLADTGTLGIKLREGRLEIKQRQHHYGTFRFHARVAGKVESWHKWSFELVQTDTDLEQALVPPRSWVAVTKQRRLRQYEVMSDEQVIAVPTDEVPERGCGVELTSVSLGGQRWWTLGFEAFGTASTVHLDLLRVARHVVAAREPPTLNVEDSCSYPRWLERLPRAVDQGQHTC